MALQISYTDRFGVPHPDAYSRVTEVYLDQLLGSAAVRVSVYATAAARRANKEAVETFTFRAAGSDYLGKFDEVGLNARSPVASGYDLVKTQAPFVGSTDV